MRRLVPLSLVVLLVLSGCLGGIGGTESTSTPEDTTASEADLPPGVNESGVQNASALIAGYNETVREEGIVLTVTENVTYEEGYREVRQLDTTLAPGGRPFNTTILTTEYRSDVESNTEPEYRRIWANESARFEWSVWSPPHEVDDSYSFPMDHAPTQAKTYLVHLQAVNYTVGSVVERDGHTFTTLIANESADNSGTWSMRFVVDERGLIHELTYDAEDGDYEAHREYRIVETNPEPPEKPDWIANVTEWPPENTTQNGSG